MNAFACVIRGIPSVCCEFPALCGKAVFGSGRLVSGFIHIIGDCAQSFVAFDPGCDPDAHRQGRQMGHPANETGVAILAPPALAGQETPSLLCVSFQGFSPHLRAAWRQRGGLSYKQQRIESLAGKRGERRTRKGRAAVARHRIGSPKKQSDCISCARRQ